MPRAEKEAKVREIAGELEGAQAAMLAGYRGLTVQEAAELRGAMLDAETRFAVVKNSLAMLAVKEAGLEGLVEYFEGPTAVAFVKGDPVTAAKRLVEQAKRFPVIEIRGGFAEGRILSAEEIRSLAALESREVMLAKIAGLGKGQIARAAWMFQSLQAKFLLLLNALKEKLPDDGGAPSEAAAAEAPAEAAQAPAEDAEAPAEAAEAPAEAAQAPAEDAEAPAEAEEAPAKTAEAPAAEDNPDPELPGGAGESGGVENVEGPDEAAPAETEPAEPGGPPSEETETETEGTEEGGE